MHMSGCSIIHTVAEEVYCLYNALYMRGMSCFSPFFDPHSFFRCKDLLVSLHNSAGMSKTVELLYLFIDMDLRTKSQASHCIPWNCMLYMEILCCKPGMLQHSVYMLKHCYAVLWLQGAHSEVCMWGEEEGGGSEHKHVSSYKLGGLGPCSRRKVHNYYFESLKWLGMH